LLATRESAVISHRRAALDCGRETCRHQIEIYIEETPTKFTYRREDPGVIRALARARCEKRPRTHAPSFAPMAPSRCWLRT